MKHILFISALLITILFSANSIFGQNSDASMKTIEDSINTLSIPMIESIEYSIRKNSSDKIDALLSLALEEENSFQYSFDSLTSISIQYPQDSSFRFFTWQLMNSPDDFSYGGYVQLEDNSYIKLSDQHYNYNDAEFERGNKDHWYGGLVYKIHQFKGTEGNEYMLFGYHEKNRASKEKYLDFIYFEDNQLVFGKPLLVASKMSTNHPSEKLRHVLNYSAESRLKLNFDPQWNAIIYDHTVPMNTSSINPVLIPDGTYEGYQLKEGKWEHIEKMFHETLDEAPRPKPVLGNKQKNIFGN